MSEANMWTSRGYEKTFLKTMKLTITQATNAEVFLLKKASEAVEVFNRLCNNSTDDFHVDVKDIPAPILNNG